MIISIHKNWRDIETKHKSFLKNLLSSYFLAYKNKKTKHTLCYDFLRKNHRYITSNNKEDYIKSILAFNDEIGRNSHINDFEKKFRASIKRVINYDSFTTKKPGYDAYDLCLKSRSKTCPYCNHSYAFSIQRHKRGFRPTLDHYYDKATYPHLALSLYNLVPSCYSCNSSLKGTSDFHLNEHLHPFFDNESFVFTLAEKKASFCNPEELLLKDISLLTIKISPQNDKETNSLDTFLINERYENFIMDALTFAQSKRSYDDIKLNDQINITREMREETSLRFNKNNYRNEMLGKLFLDIYNQFKSN